MKRKGATTKQRLWNSGLSYLIWKKADDKLKKMLKGEK